MEQGHSPEGAENVVEFGRAPAFFAGPGGVEPGIDDLGGFKLGGQAKLQTRAQQKRQLVIYSVIAALWVIAYVVLTTKGY